MRYSEVYVKIISFLLYAKSVSHHLHLHTIALFSFRRSFPFVICSLPNLNGICVRMRDRISKLMRTIQLN